MKIETATERFALTGRRLLISEEALKNESGHWYEYCRSVARANVSSGVECLIAAHAELSDQIAGDPTLVPVYTVTSWDTNSKKRPAWRRYRDILVHNYRVFRTMRRVVRERGPFDMVFAPTVSVCHIGGWRLLAALYLGRGIGRIVLVFRNNAGSYRAGEAAPKFKRSARMLALLLQSFASLVRKGAVVLATDSERLADEYEALCGLRLEVFPSPRIAPENKTPRPRHGVLTLAALGPPRFEKGTDILQAAIRLFFERRPEADVRFVIQWNEPIARDNGEAYLPDAQLAADSRVQFLTSTLSSSQYSDAIASADALILPYRRASYFARTSGVAVEGVTAGIPIIYTFETWCEGFVEATGVGIGCRDGDPHGLCGAIERFVDAFADLSERAVARAEVAREINSSEAFLAELWRPRDVKASKPRGTGAADGSLDPGLRIS